MVPLEDEEKYDLDPKDGMKISNDLESLLCAYDESIAVYSALEGKAVMVSHALVYIRPDGYLPVTYLTLRFYTRSDKIIEAAKESVVKTDNSDRQAAIDRARDKMELFDEYCIDNSVLLIDGPLIAGDAYTSIMSKVKQLTHRNILPVFIVKNSNSNLISVHLSEICKGYNSDLHWANEILKEGQRTRFFKYTDRRNSSNSKVFCYLKALSGFSPIRVELPTYAYETHLSSVDSIMNLIYYLLIVQGRTSNPQIRPIAIAEMYAREVIKLYDINREIKNANLTPTMNEERWGIE